MKISVVYLMPLAMMTFSTVAQAETILKDPIERCKSNIASSKTTGNEIVVPKSEFEKFDACIFDKAKRGQIYLIDCCCYASPITTRT
ncbi:hypothetical protein [Pseudomonas sp. RT6P73]